MSGEGPEPDGWPDFGEPSDDLVDDPDTYIPTPTEPEPDWVDPAPSSPPDERKRLSVAPTRPERSTTFINQVDQGAYNGRRVALGGLRSPGRVRSPTARYDDSSGRV